jgi:tetratricopeptide (TPR) repeat protein
LTRGAFLAEAKPARPAGVRNKVMHRFVRLATVASLAFATPLARAQSARDASAPAAASASTPLATGLDALGTSDYARATQVLAGVRGADAPAAQIALARTLLATGKYDAAEDTAKRAGGTAADKLAAIAVRAEALFRVGKVAEALKLLEPSAGGTGAGGRRIRLLLGEYRIASGHRADADDPLMKIVEEYNDGTISNSDAEGLAIVARAAHLLRSPKDANTAFNESERVAKRVETLRWRAELYLDKYDPGHADEVLREALAIAPHDPELLVASARVKLGEALDFDGAEKLVKEALAINPRLSAAFAVRASSALRDMDLAGADSAIAAGLATNPNDLELLSLRAATRFLADDRPGYEAAKHDVLARNGEFSEMYSILAELAEWEHRYDDIVLMMKEATRLDPEDAKAWAQLGLTELRGGDETNGLEALRHAWSKDHFNVRVFNTLNLYEQKIANDYETVSAGVLKVRLPKDEKKVLERYVPRLLEEAWGSMKARYNFVPQTPVQIELYSTREQFSVRTSGLPNVGIEGVCFGRVVAAMTPKNEPFNWGNVVWHELGHVFAIQLSKNHVPRWFTEGLSEYETIARRPEWRRELDPDLYLAITENRLPSAADMNRAFTHASDGADVTVAYYASSQMLVFTVEQFGMPKVVEALKLWGQGVRTPEVLSRAFGLSASDYDAKYRAWQLQKLSRYKGQFMFREHAVPLEEAKAKVAAAPNDAKAHTELAIALLRQRGAKDAQAEVDQALRLEPANMMAHYVAAKLNADDAVVAKGHLDAIKTAGGDGFQVEMGLAEIAQRKKDSPSVRAALEAAHRFDPSQLEPVQGLFKLATDEKRDADALAALRDLTMLDQHDRRGWGLLLQKLVDGKQWDEAKKVGESALFVDVENPQVHLNYARAFAATGAHDRAVFELESALACEPKPKVAATAHALLAGELVQLHRLADARAHLAEALRLDPQNADAAGLKIP